MQFRCSCGCSNGRHKLSIQSAVALEPKVINGTDAGPLSNSVAYMEVFDGNCSAAVLAPTILVTAAHCAVDVRINVAQKLWLLML